MGTGTRFFDVAHFGAQYAYTIDGETVGEIEDETFCADTAVITIKGVNVHPGFAKNRMINGIKIAAELITMLPPDTMSPETTEEREGYLHPHALKGSVEESEVVLLVRDFDVSGLKEKEAMLQQYCDTLSAKYPKAGIKLEIKESYRNMKLVLDNHTRVVDLAIDAIKRAGLEPEKRMIRGGTDGARLSFMGLPTPNIFTGGHNFHSKKEWISVQDMQKAVETIIQLCMLWAEQEG